MSGRKDDATLPALGYIVVFLACLFVVGVLVRAL